MSQPLARLRLTLDLMPSPSPEHPGLLIRDPYGYSGSMLVIPPQLTPCLACFDGRQTALDLREMLVRLTGSLEVGQIVEQLVGTLSDAGFLEDETFAAMRDQRRREFAESPVRAPAHAGSAYPAEPGSLRETLSAYMRDGAASAADGAAGDLVAIAAPHVSLMGGWRSYAAAYGQLGPEDSDKTFAILATSHYGEPGKFGLTRKSFVTPLGESSSDPRLLDWLASHGGEAAVMEDYCHSFEHTVELQVVFLQHILGPGVRILPILCGSFARGPADGASPERDEGVKRFLDVLGELRAREGDRLFWVLGVDMAHMGARYGDPFPAVAGEGRMTDVAARDEARIGRIMASDAAGFWELVRENRDDLKWCGSAPFYSFLKIAPEAKGELLRYEQWNIDEQSVVSFAGMAFRKA